MNNYAIALGVYLVGLVARSVCVKATKTNGEFEIVSTEKPKSGQGRIDKWRETRLRVGCALRSAGIDTGFSISFEHEPPLAPGLDLAIFAACLGAIGKLPSDMFVHANFNGCKIFIGELSLQGHVRPTRGVLPMLLAYSRSRTENDVNERQFVVPYDNAIEASHIDTGTSTYAIGHMSELFDLPAHTVARREYKPIEVNHFAGSPSALPERVVRAIEVAAIGGHRIAFIGEHSFKAARLLRDLLPAMTRDEAIETASMHSIARLLRNEEGQIGMRPFRAPYHTVNERGLVGGGDPIYPGELSLAHNGVLYLDSLPEFKRGAIEALAGFLRAGMVKIRRAHSHADFPAKPLLVTGCGQCPCEFRNGKHSDFCTPERRKEWQSRHLDSLGIELVVDTDFNDTDKPCSEDIETLRRWVRCAVELAKHEETSTTGNDRVSILARTIAFREGRTDILVKDLEKVVALSAR